MTSKRDSETFTKTNLQQNASRLTLQLPWRYFVFKFLSQALQKVALNLLVLLACVPGRLITKMLTLFANWAGHPKPFAKQYMQKTTYTYKPRYSWRMNLWLRHNERGRWSSFLMKVFYSQLEVTPCTKMKQDISKDIQWTSIKRTERSVGNFAVILAISAFWVAKLSPPSSQLFPLSALGKGR